jgi:FtsH-binding integral membrane protein
MLSKNTISALKFFQNSSYTTNIFYPFSRKININQKEGLQSESLNNAVSRNLGLNKFLTRVYNTTGLSILGALSTSYAVLSIPALTAMMAPLSICGFVATLGGFISTMFMKPQVVIEK